MIEHLLDSLSTYTQSHPHFGVWFAFIIAFAESLPILGTIIPGSITMTFIGILIGHNTLPLFTTILIATAGAFTGDIIGFWVGKYYNTTLLSIWPFRKYPKWVAMGEAFFKKHGGKSIIIGRFIGPTRSSMPLFAGLLKMRWLNFVLAAIPSAFLWAVAYILPGVLIGAISLTLPKNKATTFIFISLLVIVLLWVAFWAIQRFFVFIVNSINRVIDRLWNWLNRRHSAKFFIRLISNQNNPLDHHQLTLVLLACLSLVLFVITFISVILHIGVYNLNAPIFHFVESIRGHHSDKFFIILTSLGSKYVIAMICALIALYLLVVRQWYTFWYFCALTLATFGSIWVLKHIYFSPRPVGITIIKPNSSFPSGHTTLFIAQIGFLTYLAAQCLKKKWRWIPHTLTASIAAIIIFSRLYLGDHWFCDVLAGIFLAFAIVLLFLAAYRRQQPMMKFKKSYLICLALAIVLPWSYSAAKNFRANIYRYTLYFPRHSLSIQNWWTKPQHYIPIYRLSRFGHPLQPFNIQWAGHLDDINHLLNQQGWKHVIPTQDIKSKLKQLASKTPTHPLPILQPLYLGEPPVLFMTKRLPNSTTTIDIHLWRTKVKFINSKLNLFIGTVYYHTSSSSIFSFKSQKLISLKYGGGIYELIHFVNPYYQWKKITINSMILPKNVKSLHWDRSILMIQPRRMLPLDNAE